MLYNLEISVSCNAVDYNVLLLKMLGVENGEEIMS